MDPPNQLPTFTNITTPHNLALSCLKLPQSENITFLPTPTLRPLSWQSHSFHWGYIANDSYSGKTWNPLTFKRQLAINGLKFCQRSQLLPHHAMDNDCAISNSKTFMKGTKWQVDFTGTWPYLRIYAFLTQNIHMQFRNYMAFSYPAPSPTASSTPDTERGNWDTPSVGGLW